MSLFPCLAQSLDNTWEIIMKVYTKGLYRWYLGDYIEVFIGAYDIFKFFKKLIF